MALSRIGVASTEATTITIPVGHQAGDLLIIFAFRDGSTTNPTIPAGWTSITNTTDGTTCSVSAAWKIAISSTDTSGTWTSTTGLICFVFRGQATNKTPIGTFSPSAGATNTVTYGVLDPLKCPGTSWVIAFAGHRSIDTTLETAPTGLVNQTNTVGALAEYAGHDSNGVINSWPSTNVALTGTASGWQTMMIEIFAEQLNLNNFQFADVGDGMSISEKIR